MADLAITAANVLGVAGSFAKSEYVAGVAIAAGDAVYVDTANDNVLKLAHAGGTLLEATVKGIALNGAAAGQPCSICTLGDLDVGAALTVAGIYILSVNAGKICPAADLASSSFCSVLGVASATDNLQLLINNSGVEKP